MSMSNSNNKQKSKNQQNGRKRQVMSNNPNEEFGTETNFDDKKFKKQEGITIKDKPESERTAWN